MLKLNTYILLISLSFGFSTHAQGEKQMTARDLYKHIPRSYYTFNCCNDDEEEYLRTHVIAERDNYIAANDEGFNAFELAIYKHLDGSCLLLGFHSEGERWNDYYFLEYRNGVVVNVLKSGVPKYSGDNIYEYAADDKTIHVYRKEYDSPSKEINVDFRVSKGKKLYDLIWQQNHFVIKR